MSEQQDPDAVRRQLDTDDGEPAVQVAEIVADIEDVPPDRLQNTYGCIDHVLDHLFENPPAPAADVTISFTYEGYRVTVDQDGSAAFVDATGGGGALGASEGTEPGT